MDSWKRIICMALGFCCMLYGFFVIIAGDGTPAPLDGTGIITEGVNMNDAVQVVVATDGDIFVLGTTCVQRFDSEGNFTGGAYFSKNSIRKTTGAEYLSVNESGVAVFEPYKNKVSTFDEGFNLTEVIEVSDGYDENDFYDEFPNNKDSGKKADLTLSNSVKIEGEKTVLDAPRNFFVSRIFGLIVLICAGIVLNLLYNKK